MKEPDEAGGPPPQLSDNLMPLPAMPTSSSSGRRWSVEGALSAVKATGWRVVDLLNWKSVALAVVGTGVLTHAGMATTNDRTVLQDAVDSSVDHNGTWWTNSELHFALVSYVTPCTLVVACCGAAAYCDIVRLRREEYMEAFQERYRAWCRRYRNNAIQFIAQHEGQPYDVVPAIESIIKVLEDMSNTSPGLEVRKLVAIVSVI
jgi:hypothetical protein